MPPTAPDKATVELFLSLITSETYPEWIAAINYVLVHGDADESAFAYVLATFHNNIALVFHPEAPECVPLYVQWVEESQKTPMPF